MAQLNLDARQQRSLEISRDQNERDHLGFALDRARKELAFAQRETVRQDALFRTGAVAANVVDRARTTEQQRAREVRGLEAQLAGQAAVLQASKTTSPCATTAATPIRWCGFRRPPSPWSTPKAMCAPNLPGQRHGTAGEHRQEGMAGAQPLPTCQPPKGGGVAAGGPEGGFR